MKNIDKIKQMDAEELARFILHDKCDSCSLECRMKCVEGMSEWLNQEVNPMPEIKVGDVIYCNICKSRARFVVMSDIHASNLNGIFIRWREKNDIWKIERMNDETGFMEVIWRADDE